MDIEILRQYLLSKPSVTEDCPFGPETLVFRIGGKMFALLGLNDSPQGINLKCDPERAVELRAAHPAIIPGYHMNKRHWNTVTLDGSLPRTLVFELVDHSFQLVADSLPKKQRAELGL